MDPIETTGIPLDQLRQRIADLEEKLLAQRVGKRVLLQLLELNRLEQGEKLMKLERENRRLRERIRALHRILRELNRKQGRIGTGGEPPFSVDNLEK